MVLIPYALSCCTSFYFFLILVEFLGYQKYGEGSDYYKLISLIVFLMSGGRDRAMVNSYQPFP